MDRLDEHIPHASVEHAMDDQGGGSKEQDAPDPPLPLLIIQVLPFFLSRPWSGGRRISALQCGSFGFPFHAFYPKTFCYAQKAECCCQPWKDMQEQGPHDFLELCALKMRRHAQIQRSRKHAQRCAGFSKP